MSVMRALVASAPFPSLFPSLLLTFFSRPPLPLSLPFCACYTGKIVEPPCQGGVAPPESPQYTWTFQIVLKYNYKRQVKQTLPGQPGRLTTKDEFKQMERLRSLQWTDTNQFYKDELPADIVSESTFRPLGQFCMNMSVNVIVIAFFSGWE